MRGAVCGSFIQQSQHRPDWQGRFDKSPSGLSSLFTRIILAPLFRSSDPLGCEVKDSSGCRRQYWSDVSLCSTQRRIINVRALGHTVEIERAWAREWTTGLSEGMTRGESNAESKHRAAHGDFLTNSHGTFPSQ